MRQDKMNVSRFVVLAVLLIAQTGTAEAKAYKGAEVYSLESALYGRVCTRRFSYQGLQRVLSDRAKQTLPTGHVLCDCSAEFA
jgi:hypothetical protein